LTFFLHFLSIIFILCVAVLALSAKWRL